MGGGKVPNSLTNIASPNSHSLGLLACLRLGYDISSGGGNGARISYWYPEPDMFRAVKIGRAHV